MPGPVSIDPNLAQADYLLSRKNDALSALRTGLVPGQDRSAAARIARAHFSQALAVELGHVNGGGSTMMSKAIITAPSFETQLARANVRDDIIERRIENAVRESLKQDLSPAPPMVGPKSPLGLMEQIARYKEDQLLANPGGDHYHTDRTKNVIVKPDGPSGFIQRVGKDLKDAGRNFLNMIENFLAGAEYKYRAADGSIGSGRHSGLLGTVGKFFRNLASGLSFGAYIPEGETVPVGAWGRTKHFFKKVFGEALVNNLVAGAPRAVGHMLKDGALGVLNLAEAVADATIGSLPKGERLVTKTFDNAQVLLSYVMDILPYGDAWSRVLSPGSADQGLALPLVYNLNSPVTGIQDSNWVRVRNTPFRKAIETAGSVMTSALSFLIPNWAFPKPAGTGGEIQTAHSRRPIQPAPLDPVYAEQAAAARRVAAPESPESPVLARSSWSGELERGPDLEASQSP